jgi:hypothetical protein
MKIRTAQVEVLERSVREAFENELITHLQAFAPGHYRFLGKGVFRRIVQSGIERAARYGLTNRGPIRFYIELMFMFGSEFDSDPWLPWAGGCLNDDSIDDETSRAEVLHDEMLSYLDEVDGPGGEYSLAALKALHGLTPEDYPVGGPDFDDMMLRGLAAVYPAKCEYLGESSIRALIGRGQEMAAHYSADTDLGVTLFIGLLFILGHAFDRDMLFPWVPTVLADRRLRNAERRAERLHARARTYLAETLAFLKQG